MTKTVNVYIVCDLADWPRNPTNNFNFKNCSFGATNIVKNSDKEKYVYKEHEITFDSGGSWSFDNCTARNVIIFGVDRSSSLYDNNCKNNFFVLGLGTTYGISKKFGTAEKKVSINFTKSNVEFCLSLHYYLIFYNV